MSRFVISVPLIIVVSCLFDNRDLLAEDSPSVLVKYMKPAASKELWADLPAWMSAVTIYSQPDTALRNLHSRRTGQSERISRRRRPAI
jgi:hypothetical protein